MCHSLFLLFLISSVFVIHFPISEQETKFQNLTEQGADLKFCYEIILVILQQSILELII
jgi:hypothetical protein